MDIFPDNTVAHYRVHLPHPLEFADEQEVALTGLIYPLTWYNFPTGRDYWFTCQFRSGCELQPDHATSPGPEIDGERTPPDEHDDVIRVMRLRPGYYDSPQRVVRALNNSARQMPVNFRYGSVTGKIFAKAQYFVKDSRKWPQLEVKLSPDLAYKLGWEDREQQLCFREEAPEEIESPGVAQMSDVDVLYINCDLAGDYHIVGSSKVPLLKSVAVKSGAIHGDTVLFEPRVLDWIPLRHKRITSVEVLITDSTGRPVPFERGRSSIKVQLRRRSRD